MSSNCLKCGAVISLAIIIGVQLCEDCLINQPKDLLSNLKTPPISENIRVIEVSGAVSSVQSSAMAGVYLFSEKEGI